MRPLRSLLAFLLAAAVLFCAMLWLTALILRFDRQQAEAQRQALVEESVRLALWRMDAGLTALLARENARPYFHYAAFFPAERAYNRMFQEYGSGEILLASPLLAAPVPDVRLHFQVAPGGGWTSPQVPEASMRRLAESKYGGASRIPESAASLAELERRIGAAELARGLPADGPLTPSPAPPPAARTPPLPPVAAPEAGPQQVALNAREWQVRVNQQADQQQRAFAANAAMESPAVPARVRGAASAGVGEGVMQPVWFGDELVLLRRVTVDRQTYVQGCWLDWPAIKRELIGQVGDLFAHADLAPVAPGDRDGGRRLAALPLRFVPGEARAAAPSASSPARLSLAIAWACVLLAVGAFGFLLAGATALSERRASFVSAVTHELRTPLTTFRMYAEMLAEDMVPEEARRREYLRTLWAESARLSHLVENVLAYARLERGRAAGRVEPIPPSALLDRMEERLRLRAAQAGMTLVREPADGMEAALETDASAVEQILFNLVDNACKYAGRAADRRIHLEPRADGRDVVIRVRDHGPGISRSDARRLFRPFHKSAQRAANSAPGVGLGLSLSRRLARRLGGDLRLASSPGEGACFELRLK